MAPFFKTEKEYRALLNRTFKKGKEMNDQMVNEIAPTEQLPTDETPKVEAAKPEGFQVEAQPAVDTKPVG